MSNSRTAILNICSKIAQLALPQSCLLCGARPAAPGICEGCREDLPWLPAERCPVCAIPTRDGAVCGACLARRPPFDRTFAPLAYEWPIDRMISAYKYGERLELAPVLARLLDSAVPGDDPPEVLVPMPLAPGRLAERGFNQARELARVLGAARGLRVLPEAVRRIRDGPPQAALPHAERVDNVRRAFVCDADLDGLSVAIVDDVMTTGSTLAAIAREVRRRGARRIDCWVVARTLAP